MLYSQLCLGINNCLPKVFDIIESNLDELQQQKLIQGLEINFRGESIMLPQKLENIPWNKIKRQLELLGRNDVVNIIQKNTLITKGIV